MYVCIYKIFFSLNISLLRVCRVVILNIINTMKTEEIPLIIYDDVINKIKNQENHLLIGNGFNRGLGIDTSYAAIFNMMIKNDFGVYRDVQLLVEECGNDLEKFIGRLEKDINPDNKFLKKYINNKIKLDFMKATHKIVKSNIKNIYAKECDGAFLFLQNFTNYFTLNYDSLLYNLLLKYKTTEKNKNNAIAFPISIKFIEKELNSNQNNIYKEIKEAREKGMININFGDDDSIVQKPLGKTKKTVFTTTVIEYSDTYRKGWKTNDIERVVNQIFDEEQKNKIIKKVDDGSRYYNLNKKSDLLFNADNDTQNLFFLHGAFHIYKHGHYIKKITQETDKALYTRLEEILNDEHLDLVCVFQQENKLNVIKNNEYLLNCFTKLEKLKGNLVIIGCSLADNDNHIFQQINKSGIENIYISTLKKNKDKIYSSAKEKFTSKEIYIFDARTISYELPEK